MTGVTLDTGALIALESGSKRVATLLAVAMRAGATVCIPAGVVAQAWRGGPRQARIAHLLNAETTEVVPLDDALARAVGIICGQTKVPDIVDVSVVLCARSRNHVIVTSDPSDIRAVDPRIRVELP